MTQSVNFDPQSALRGTRELLAEVEQHRSLHRRAVPHFPVGAAGAVLAEQGRALAHMFTALHEGTDRSYAKAERITAKAHSQMMEFVEVDDGSARALGAIDVGGGKHAAH